MNKDINMCVILLIDVWRDIKPWYENLFPNRVLEIGCTQRTPIEQLILFCQGRLPLTMVNLLADNDVEDEIVTWKDGFIKKSKHNEIPLSKALDIWIKIDGEYVWDEKYFLPFGRFIQDKYPGIIRWGGDFNDCCHIEVV